MQENKLAFELGALLIELSLEGQSDYPDDDAAILITACLARGVLVRYDGIPHEVWFIFGDSGRSVLPDSLAFSTREFCWFAWLGTATKKKWHLGRAYDPMRLGVNLLESEDFEGIFEAAMAAGKEARVVFSVKYNCLICLGKAFRV